MLSPVTETAAFSIRGATSGERCGCHLCAEGCARGVGCGLPAARERSGRSSGPTDDPMIVVADGMSELAREELSRAEVAWLDRRDHL